MEKNITYFLYRRKSTDETDRQILSLESQEAEAMKKFSDLKIIKLPAESVSAFEPYKRPVFADMVARIQKGEAQGIIAWHPDRLSRNPMDAAQIIYLVDTGAIKDLKFCSYYFDNSPEGKMMLQITLSQSKYSSDKLSKDVKRGTTRKVELGWRPGRAPLGFLNTKTGVRGEQYIMSDPERFTRVRKLFDLMLSGTYTVPKLLDVMNDELALRIPATRKRASRPITLSGLYKILTNPFYYGWFQWNGEWFQGKHEPMITAEEFDRVQYLLGRKGQPRQKSHKFAFTGMLRCGGCGAMVTAEEKFKTLKNGRTLHFIYYHCTWKKLPKCTERSIEINEFHKQIDETLARLTISDRFKDWAIRHLHEVRKTEARTREETLAAKQRLLEKVTKDLDALILRYTASSNANEEILTTGEFQALKGRLLKEKTTIEDDLKLHGAELENWVELSEKTFNFARYARAWFANGDMDTKRAIFACLSSNPTLKDQRIILNLQKPFQMIFEQRDLCEQALDRVEPQGAPAMMQDGNDSTKEFGLLSG